jgi:hypothetical protein
MFLGVAAIRRPHVVFMVNTQNWNLWILASHPEIDVAEAVDAGFKLRAKNG